MVDVVTIRINGAAAVDAKLTQAVAQLKDLRVPNKALSVQLYGWVIKNFDSQGGSVGGWTALAASTIERKKKLGKEKMLVISGALRSSYLPGSFYDDTKAGVGSALEYAPYHQDGTNRMPQREMLPRLEDVRTMALNVYNFYVAKVTRQANQ